MSINKRYNAMNKALNSIKSKLKGSIFLSDFIRISNISNESARAYLLGLFFDNLNKEDLSLYISLKRELSDIIKYYKEYSLLGSFLQRDKPIRYTNNILGLTGSMVGLIVIILGILKQYRGEYYMAVSLKTQQPVYGSGLFLALLGLTILAISFSSVRKGLRIKRLMKKYKKQ